MCIGRSGGEVRCFGRISDEFQYEDNGLQCSDYFVVNFIIVIVQLVFIGNLLYLNVRDFNFVWKFMLSLVFSE